MALAHDLPLISTIAIGFTTAFIFGLIASRLKLSPIVGYLIAGIVVGPYTPGVEADMKIAEQLSELGILLLMFGVGLHFSVKDLMAVKRIALPGAIVQIAVATFLGCALTYFWGWSLQSGIIFGLALSVASTVVLLRALEEHNLLSTNDGNIAIGWLIVEDIVMVLALVMIPALATNATDAGNTGVNWQSILTDLAIALGKVAIFVVFMLVAGKRLLPWLLEVVARERSRELFTLSVFAVAMGIAFGAAKLFGISFALGAFFAGMMIRESDLSHEAADKALPLQDAFAVLFFVSVGMLFNPTTIIEMPLKVLAVVAIITIGKMLASGVLVLLFRYPVRTSLVVSAGLAQIGEFSFILANLGVAYRIIPEEGRDLILAGALISITINPLFFHISDSVQGIILRRFKSLRKNEAEQGSDELAYLSRAERQSLTKTVIIIGYGRVGKHVLTSLHDKGLQIVVVDSNRERVAELRAEGHLAISADATHEDSLHDAAISKAFAVVVAVPNPYRARKIVEVARKAKSSVKILVRAHNDEEMEYFSKQPVDLAIMGSREVARCMVEYISQEKL